MATRKKKLKTGVDTRPWSVVRDGEVVVRCWYKSTAQDWAAEHGGQVKRRNVKSNGAG